MQLSKKQKSFSWYSSGILKSSLNFELFQKKKKTLIVNVFLRLRTLKHVVRSMSKKSRFTGPLEEQDGKWVKILLKFERPHMYHLYWSMSRQLSCKKSLLVICKILTLFVSTLSNDGKYSFLKKDNLTQPIQM